MNYKQEYERRLKDLKAILKGNLNTTFSYIAVSCMLPDDIDDLLKSSLYKYFANIIDNIETSTYTERKDIARVCKVNLNSIKHELTQLKALKKLI